MRRTEQLIERARELSGNTRYDSDSGATQTLFVQNLKTAQASLVRSIINSKCKFFMTSSTTAIVNGQEAYSYPSDIYLRSLDTLEWAQDNINYIRVEKTIVKERMSYDVAGYPFGYIPRYSDILLNPPITNGTLRFNYNKRINAPEKRSGKITAVTASSGSISAITVNTSEASFDATYINQDNTLCVVDKYGVQKALNIDYTSVSSSTGVFTLSSQTLSGSVAVGDYVTVGANTCNKPELDDACEDYLITFMEYLAKYGDASKWSRECKENLKEITGELINNFNLLSDDITSIPITNIDYISMW